MGLFSNKSPFDAVTKISVFPTISAVVLRKDDRLVVFNPRYLLGKHGTGTDQIASKFMNLRTATQLLELIDRNISASALQGQKVELKEINFGEPVGFDALVKLPLDLVDRLKTEDVRGNEINVIPTDRGKVPQTSLLNIILVPFDPKYGDGVDNLFKAKYGNFMKFENFKFVYAIVTIYPGKFAPPMTDRNWWREHALLREI
ncbi:hypothetical protein JXB28_03575 [Candidatus Woesearchaeota archaeon]|nr:hypothetical protein [Candidatus Woesearchaeota archaeon]